MKIFDVIRDEDQSGVSGTGRVAECVEFENGRVAMTWLGDIQSVVVYDCISDALAIHGHEGKTRFELRLQT